MQNITRTAYGIALQTQLFSGLPTPLIPFTTLNEKLQINQGVAPAAGQTPTATYLCIGNGGHSIATGTNNIPLINQVQHEATDAALYNMLPFVLRPINNDIDSGYQANFALRRTETYNGAQYYAYYLRRIPTAGAVTTMLLQTTSNGVTTSTPFTPSSANLNPTPPVINSSGVNVLTSQYINVAATLPLTFTQQDCTELLNVANVIYGDPSYAIISEMGICSGVDYPTSLSSGNSFNEAIAVQITSFIATMHLIQFTATGINASYVVGSNDPLLVLGGQS